MFEYDCVVESLNATKLYNGFMPSLIYICYENIPSYSLTFQIILVIEYGI